ncbi:odorant receptor 23a-like [Linepithema humile]|uniref:odorant receptor 23a-like n=1 Tax=Linepithema humile TaxID=83485 RepID=UPI00351EE21B
MLMSISISAYKSRENIDVSMKTLSQFAALTEATFNAIICRSKRKQLQKLLLNIENFIKISKDHERNMIQKYTDRYMTFILIVATSFVVAAITVICEPLVLPMEFPINVWYPFSTKPPLRKFIIYNLQIFVIAHTVSCLGVDVMIAVLLFYPTAKLEILASEIEQATNEIQVISCIRKHQEITRFVSETQEATQYVLFKTTLTMGFTVISGSFPILYLQSYILIPQFLSMIIAALQRMYITAWAANDLKEVSTRLCWSVYSVSWIGNSQKVKNDVFLMLQRSQKPLLISMSGLLPSLTLEYYGGFIVSVMSYFMTMRAAIVK